MHLWKRGLPASFIFPLWCFFPIQDRGPGAMQCWASDLVPVQRLLGAAVYFPRTGWLPCIPGKCYCCCRSCIESFKPMLQFTPRLLQSTTLWNAIPRDAVLPQGNGSLGSAFSSLSFQHLQHGDLHWAADTRGLWSASPGDPQRQIFKCGTGSEIRIILSNLKYTFLNSILS